MADERKTVTGWIRDNYGWKAKSGSWAMLAFGVIAAVAVLLVFAQ